MSSEEDVSSDDELEIASSFKKNTSNVRKMIIVNNVAEMKERIEEIHLNLPWVETFDVSVDIATLPDGENLKDIAQSESTAENDFKREMIFYNQAKAAAMEGIHRSKKLGIPTQRPNDYFAEMAKPDTHMTKVREKLLSKQMMIERSEKARELREQKKHGKKIQQEILKKRQSEKKVLMDALKKGKKGKIDAATLLEEKKNNPAGKPPQKRKWKDQYKNDKYGYGGKKKRSKYNTAESSAYFPSNNRSKFPKGKGQNQKKRPGKWNRKNKRNA